MPNDTDHKIRVVASANAAKTHCSNGHPYSPENTIRLRTHPTERRCRECKKANYKRWRQGRRAAGKPDLTRQSFVRHQERLALAQCVADLGDSFWSHVDKNGPSPACAPELGPCWLWTAAIGESGYASWYSHRVHRLTYRAMRGLIAEELTIDHLCRVRHCVNPDHLEAVTMRENTMRGFGPTASNARKTHCSKGHEYTAENTTIIPSRPTRRICLKCRVVRNRAGQVRRTARHRAQRSQ